jgi:hypothetical protein
VIATNQAKQTRVLSHHAELDRSIGSPCLVPRDVVYGSLRLGISSYSQSSVFPDTRRGAVQIEAAAKAPKLKRCGVLKGCSASWSLVKQGIRSIAQDMSIHPQSEVAISPSHLECGHFEIDYVVEKCGFYRQFPMSTTCASFAYASGLEEAARHVEARKPENHGVSQEWHKFRVLTPSRCSLRCDPEQNHGLSGQCIERNKA